MSKKSSRYSDKDILRKFAEFVNNPKNKVVVESILTPVEIKKVIELSGNI